MRGGQGLVKTTRRGALSSDGSPMRTGVGIGAATMSTTGNSSCAVNRSRLLNTSYSSVWRAPRGQGVEPPREDCFRFVEPSGPVDLGGPVHPVSFRVRVW